MVVLVSVYKNNFKKYEYFGHLKMLINNNYVYLIKYKYIQHNLINK